MKVAAIIQARSGSTRLPGKVLKDICGKPMLEWQISRLRQSLLLDDIVVATTSSSLDDPIESLCQQLNVTCYRGSESDVLDRVTRALANFNIDLHVECYGDSPLIDPLIVDQFIGFYLKSADNLTYLSNSITTSYPPGMEVSVYSSSLLSDLNSKLSSEDPLREHVGYNITRFPKTYKLKSLTAPPSFQRPELFLEVDTPTDFAVISKIMNYFISRNIPYPSLSQLIEYADLHPEIFSENKLVERRWKKLRENTATIN